MRYYKEAYEREKQKSRLLASRLAEAESRVADVEQNLARIKNSVFWKLSKPLRDVIHWMQRTKERIGRYGNIKGILRKLDAKQIEKKAKAQHGTAGFPTPEEVKRQRETVFTKKIKISILVPLYNTPKNLLSEAIDSVIAQTYENWELCLADGSDAEHAYVEQICREYSEKDNRILYQKLEKNGGISDNTNRCLAMATGDYIGLFDHDDILHPSVLFEYMRAICDEDADYIYCDETTFHGDSIDNMITLHFKPDFAIDNLRANNYICHFSV
ncbi:MAG: glycosyltransferase, partial [Lachnospiraceae bacterium]|nr:glycosyltransferase [Lachnospiraceae bacterium]